MTKHSFSNKNPYIAIIFFSNFKEQFRTLESDDGFSSHDKGRFEVRLNYGLKRSQTIYDCLELSSIVLKNAPACSKLV